MRKDRADYLEPLMKGRMAKGLAFIRHTKIFDIMGVNA